MVTTIKEHCKKIMSEYTINLTINNQFQDNIEYLKEIIEDLYLECIENTNSLLEMLKVFYDPKILNSVIEEKNFKLKIEKVKDKVTIIKEEKAVNYSLHHFLNAIQAIKDLSQTLLPLGSAVILNDPSQKNSSSETIFIITERFLIPEGIQNGYFDYAGVMYPVGSIQGSQEKIMFSHSEIKKIIHSGYVDQIDIDYQLMIKAELIGNKKFKSIDLKIPEFKRKLEKGTLNVF